MKIKKINIQAYLWGAGLSSIVVLFLSADPLRLLFLLIVIHTIIVSILVFLKNRR